MVRVPIWQHLYSSVAQTPEELKNKLELAIDQMTPETTLVQMLEFIRDFGQLVTNGPSRIAPHVFLGLAAEFDTDALAVEFVLRFSEELKKPF